MFQVKQAKRQRRPLKVNLEGVSGSGKTFTALRLAFAMRRAGIGKKIVVLDSENESAGLYDGVTIDGETWVYDVCPMPHEKQNPVGYTEAYEFLVGGGYDLIIGDSLTHAWYGAQEQVDRYAATNKGDKFGGWAKVTPQQRHMLATLTDGRAHFIGTMRVKSEYEKVMNERTGKEQMKKVGTKTDQRDGAEYEFDCVVRLDRDPRAPTEHLVTVEKVRGCTAMDGRHGVNPGPDFWKPLLDWWLSAEAVSPTQAFDDARASLKKAATEAELREAFTPIYKARQQFTTDQWAALERLKDERKFALAPAPQQQPATDADLAAREDYLARLRYACDRVGTGQDEFVARHAGLIGVAAGQTAPRHDALTLPQLELLVGLAEQER